MRNAFLKKKLLATTFIAGLAGSLTAGLVYAQDTEEDTPVVIEEIDEDDEARQEKVVVTGSRLSRTEFSSVSPLQIVDGEAARDLGLIDAQSLLTNTSVISGQQNTLGVSTAFNGGLQQAFTTIGNVSPSLRGLGSGVTGRARTLVLVNGRRLGPIGVGGAPANPDISLIPGSLVSQIDVLLDGASSIYGSDAVAGVINYVLRDEFDGVEVNYYQSISEHGWGKNEVLSLTTGVSNDRGFMGFSMEFNSQKDVTVGNILSDHFGPVTDVHRGFVGPDTAFVIPPQICSADIGVLPGGSERRVCSGTPSGFAIVSGLGNVIGATGGPVTPGSTEIPGAPGFFLRPSSASFFRPSDDPAINGFPQDLSDTVQPPTERFSLYTIGEYDLNTYGDMTLFFEGNYGNRQLETRQTNQEVLPFSAENPFNPFGRDGLFVYSVENGVDQEIDLARALFGLRGDLPEFNPGPTRNWAYEVSANFHRSNGFQALSGYLQEDRIAQGLNSRIDETGNIVCDAATGTNPATGGFSFFGFDTVRAPTDCVPLNPFVPEFLTTGRFATEAQNEFAYGLGTVQTEVEQIIFSAFIQGELFEFPQGDAAQFLIGTEYREDQVVTTPGDSTRYGLLQGVDADLGATGRRDIREGFAELSLPILKNQPFARSLLLEGAARWTEEQYSGAAWTYQVKGEYAPLNYLRFRAGYGTSFRAPDLGEQFGTGTVFVQPSRIDPCIVSSLQIDSGTGQYDPDSENRDPVVLQNCRDLGLDPTTLGTVNQEDGDPTTTAFVSLPVAFGNFGNQTVSPEESDAFFAGIVFDQPFYDEFDFQIAATYYEYEITGQIGQLTRGQILGDCFESVGLTDPLCAFQTRDASGNLVAVNEASINLGPTTSRGLDFNVSAATEVSRFTEDPIELTWDLVMTRSLENKDETTPGEVDDNLGRILLGGPFPKYQAVSTIRADWKDWSMNWRTRWISELDGTPDQGGAFAACYDVFADERIEGCVEKDYIDDTFQHDLTVVLAKDTWSIRAGVLNLFDDVDSFDDDKALANVAIQTGADFLGRRFFASVSKSF